MAMRRTDLIGVDEETHRQRILRARAMTPGERLDMALKMTAEFFQTHRRLERWFGMRISLYPEFDHLFQEPAKYQ